MSEKFQNKYRIPSARLKHWDYRWNGAYFLTICTKDRECFLGNITDGQMKLSNAGIIANVLWCEIKNHEKNIQLGEFIVMPNHVHGILILDNDSSNNEFDNGSVVDVQGTAGTLNVETLDPLVVETLHATSLHNQSEPTGSKNEIMSHISPKSGSISTIVRSYKSAVTKHCNRLGIEFAWQPRFHDHIIRDERSFNTISEYIINNPSKWSEDKFYRN